MRWSDTIVAPAQAGAAIDIARGLQRRPPARGRRALLALTLLLAPAAVQAQSLACVAPDRTPVPRLERPARGEPVRKPPTTGETRHSVAEHHEIEEALNDLAATDMSEGGWLTKFKSFEHQYRHHIDEEEEDHFPDFERHLDEDDMKHMERVFERRKDEEMAEAEVTPEKKEDAKE